jgi:hypothetical protein
MYGHPKKPDPYAERQPIPPCVAPDKGFPAGYLILAVPLTALAFTVGYASAAFGLFV